MANASKAKHKKLKFDYKKLRRLINSNGFYGAFFYGFCRCFEGEHKLIGEHWRRRKKNSNNFSTINFFISSRVGQPTPDNRFWSGIMLRLNVQRAGESESQASRSPFTLLFLWHDERRECGAGEAKASAAHFKSLLNIKRWKVDFFVPSRAPSPTAATEGGVVITRKLTSIGK